MIGRPKFEVVVAASAEDRRLVSVETIRSLTGLSSTGSGAIDDAGLGVLIDASLATMARSCGLAKARAMPLTLAQEAVRATWLADVLVWPRPLSRAPCDRLKPPKLLLPWRAPITDIAVTDGEAELVEDADFRLLGAGVVERINGSWATSGSIVVDYTAGFVPLASDPAYQVEGDPMPADLVSLIADQVRMSADRRDIDLNLRSEDVPELWSGNYNVAGGSALDTGGLMMPLYEALAPYRAPPSIG